MEKLSANILSKEYNLITFTIHNMNPVWKMKHVCNVIVCVMESECKPKQDKLAFIYLFLISLNLY